MPFSDDPKELAPGAVTSSQPRRRRLAAASGAGLVAIAFGTWLLLGIGPEPGGHAPMTICAVNSASLRADVDADGHLDEIHDQDRDGTGSVVFRRGDHRTTVGVGEARGFWQKLRGALKEDMETRGTFGDFDGDGYADLALFYSQDDVGDSPRDGMVVHEVRYGPLARDLSSERTATIRMPISTFVYGARATDTDHDGRAELQVFQSVGDGGVSRYVGRQEGGGVSVSPGEADFYGVPEWPASELGWLDFGACRALGVL
ncbi:hypothetical protein ABT001_29935 [Streptomyces sp. NPDC002793]|uniref:hypothetical protein n=1 Tax=Streptomyces sp. NPDC002793 TaxID=3154432 RepID=UPI0033261836